MSARASDAPDFARENGNGAKDLAAHEVIGDGPGQDAHRGG
jgi:hypothetical protein